MHSTNQPPLSTVLRVLAAKLVSVILLLVLMLPAFAAIEAVEFDNPETANRYQSIIAELRCLVCQNQNLADSDAELAKDLRRKTAEMIKSGNTDAEILSYMQERYGDFVLYRPPFNINTALLWVGPFVLLLFTVFFLFLRTKRRQNDDLSTPLSERNEEQRIAVRDLMKNAPPLTKDPADQNNKDSK